MLRENLHVCCWQWQLGPCTLSDFHTEEHTMAKKLISILIVVVCLPSLAHAQVYKCQSPYGSISFQDHPCQKGAAGSAINLEPAQGYSTKDVRQSFGNRSSAPQSSETARYPYARGDDVKRLKAENAELQTMNTRMKKENPNWQHSQTLKRLNAEAEALNGRIQADNKLAH
jgi:hypothetical protein